MPDEITGLPTPEEFADLPEGAEIELPQPPRIEQTNLPTKSAFSDRRVSVNRNDRFIPDGTTAKEEEGSSYYDQTRTLADGERVYIKCWREKQPGQNERWFVPEAVSKLMEAQLTVYQGRIRNLEDEVQRIAVSRGSGDRLLSAELDRVRRERDSLSSQVDALRDQLTGAGGAGKKLLPRVLEERATRKLGDIDE